MDFKQSLYFTYDGIDSRDLGIAQISTQSGLYEETVGLNRSILEEKIEGSDATYTFGFNNENREFPLEIYFENGFTDDSLNELKRLLYKGYYKPLVFEDKPHFISYCTPIGEPKLTHTGNGEGYYVVTMRTNSPYIFSPVTQSLVYDCTANNDIQYVEFVNDGSYPIIPDLYINKFEDGDFEIINTSDRGISTKFTGLVDGETVYVDGENEDIETDLTQTYRIENFNHNYLTLIAGMNRLAIRGKGSFYLEYQFKF